MANTSWTLDSALPIIRQIAGIAKKHGFDVALYGSVLRHGRSENDLGLYFVTSEVMTTPVNAKACVKEVAEAVPDIELHQQAVAAYRLQLKDGGCRCTVPAELVRVAGEKIILQHRAIAQWLALKTSIYML